MEANMIELLCKLPHAANLQQICDLTYQITGNPVFISDMAHTILSYTKCVEVPDQIWQENIVQNRLERNTLHQDREVSVVHESSSDERRPVMVEDSYQPYPRIIKTLISKGQPVGVMVVTAYLKPFDQGDIDLVDLISSFVLPRMMEERYHISDDKRTVENYFIKLLDGAQFSRERVAKRLDILGYQCREHIYVLTVCAAPCEQPQTRSALGPLLQAFRRIDGCRVFLYNSVLVCVYGSDRDISDWDTQAPELAELLRRENLLAGISRRVQGLEQLKDYHRQAQSTLELSIRLGRLGRFFRYDSLSAFLLFQSVPRNELNLYCHQKIQELGEYDDAHHMDLCATLQVYLEQAKSLSKTAEILFIHRNTVRYRINKCMELMHTDLEDGNEIFSYILSLRILEYIKKLTPGTVDAGG